MWADRVHPHTPRMDPDRWDPDAYRHFIRAEIPEYDRLQDELAIATRDLVVGSILDLGVGTGETARRVLDEYPKACLLGVDESRAMLAAAEQALDRPCARFELRRLEDPPPPGPFDLLVSALAVHHLDEAGKARLFAQLHHRLRPGGRFVLADVVIPERAEDAVTPTDPTYDRPSSAAAQLDWLRAAGFVASIVWRGRDLAVLVADRGEPRRHGARGAA